jgi:cytochrome c biogenesis protein CcmG, thiol:disulfide interchange protein DsbE
MRSRIFLGLALSVLLILSTVAIGFAAEKKLPAFSVKDLKGKPHRSDELIGEGVVLFNFWATWCKPCLAEQPKLQEFEAEWREAGFRVVSVSIDDPRTAKQVRPFIKRHKIDFPVYLDSNQEAYRKLGGRAVPFNVLVGSDGTVLSVTMGYKEKDAETWAALIAADVADQAAGEAAGE